MTLRVSDALQPLPGRRTLAAFRPYLPIALLTPVMAVVGFWATYYGRVLTGTVETPPIIQVHAAIFIGWLLIVIVQAALAASGRIVLHVKAGKLGFAYGAVVIAFGVISALWSFETHFRAGNIDRASFSLFVGLTDIATFALFLAAAWVCRRRPEAHKRLIIVATTVLLIAPVHRMHWFLGQPAPVAAILSIWLAPVYLGMICDFVKRRLVHPVYVLGIVAILFMKFGRAHLHDSATWGIAEAWFRALI